MNTATIFNCNRELGESCLHMGEWDKAGEYYLRAANADAQSAEPYLGLATVAVQRGELDTALVLYWKAAELECSDKALCGIALVSMEQGNHLMAFDYFMLALSRRCDNMVALNGLVREAYRLGRVDEILPRLEKALASGTESEAVRLTLAGCLIFLGRNVQARQYIDAVLRDAPDHLGARELAALAA